MSDGPGESGGGGLGSIALGTVVAVLLVLAGWLASAPKASRPAEVGTVAQPLGACGYRLLESGAREILNFDGTWDRGSGAPGESLEALPEVTGLGPGRNDETWLSNEVASILGSLVSERDWKIRRVDADGAEVCELWFEGGLRVIWPLGSDQDEVRRRLKSVMRECVELKVEPRQVDVRMRRNIAVRLTQSPALPPSEP